MHQAASLRAARVWLTLSLAAASTPLFAQNSEAGWLERSNDIAYKVLEMSAHFVPEFSGQQGIEGFDEEIIDLRPNLYERQQAVNEQKLEFLQAQRAAEQDPRVVQDIEIMLEATREEIESNRVNHERVLPYGNLTGLVFFGFNGLLDKQVPLERQQAALVRLKKYTGQAEGYEPLTRLARERLSERLDVGGLIMPFKGEVEQDLQRAPVVLEGIASVFESSALSGWESDLALLTEQLGEYKAWVEETILPVARPDAALPRELYELALENYGVDATPEELIRTGQVAFVNIRNEMMALAPLVAAEKGWQETDYRDVAKRLKENRVYGDDLMSAYREAMAALDRIIEREELVSLPDEPARARMATPRKPRRSRRPISTSRA